MPKMKGTDYELLDMAPDPLTSFAPDKSTGMRARLEAIANHPKERPINEHGQEMPDPTPQAPPVGYLAQPPLAELIQQMVRSEHVKFQAEQLGVDTFEEADDLEIMDDDEYEPDSPWQPDFDPLPPGELSRRRQAAYLKEIEDGFKESPPQPPPVGRGQAKSGPLPKVPSEPEARPTPPPGPAGPSPAAD